MFNTMKTAILMAALTALFLVAGQAMAGQQGMTVALILAVGMNVFAYWFSDSMALAMSGAQPLPEHAAPHIHRLVAHLAARAGIPKPRLYRIPSPTPNAFATGRNPSHAAVAVTDGLVEILDENQLAGVLAHELAHIKNRDILISTVAAVIAGAISYLANMAQWAMLFGGLGRNDDEEGGGGSLVGSLVMMLVAPLAAALIQMAISRSREFAADATGAAICGSPAALAGALERLEAYNRRLPMAVNPATAQMYIVNPLRGTDFASLFSTHPPIQERIRRLLAMER